MWWFKKKPSLCFMKFCNILKVDMLFTKLLIHISIPNSTKNCKMRKKGHFLVQNTENRQYLKSIWYLYFKYFKFGWYLILLLKYFFKNKYLILYSSTPRSTATWKNTNAQRWQHVTKYFIDHILDLYEGFLRKI